MSAITEVPVDRVVAGNNDRTSFDDGRLADLATSIRQHGLAQPIIVRPAGERYEIVAGERRFRAISTILGWTTVPAIVRSYDDRAAGAVMLAENTARVDLDPIDEADAYAKRSSEGWTVADIAAAAGVSRSRVQSHLAIADLSDEARDLIRTRNLSVSAAQWLVGLDANRQHLAITAMVSGDLTPSQLARVCQRLRTEQDQDGLFGDDFMRVEAFEASPLFDIERTADLIADAQSTCRFGPLGEARVMIERLLENHPDADLVDEARMLIERLNGRPAIAR